MNISKKWYLALGIALCAAIGVMAAVYPGDGSSALADMSEPQDVSSLDRRISSLEQRLYSIETSINRLQLAAISERTQAVRSSDRDPEISLLRGEIQALRQRVNEIECGLIKLDERTTSSSIREARGSAATRITDPCRLNPAAPLRLSTRP